jgi:hypothetical protein
MEIGGRQVQQVTVDAVVIRADGRREPLGTIGYWNRAWHKRLMYRIRRLLERNATYGRPPGDGESGAERDR